MYNTLMSMSDLVPAHPLMSFALLLPLVTIYVMPMLIASERRPRGTYSRSWREIRRTGKIR
jgi:hypothetical protein